MLPGSVKVIGCTSEHSGVLDTVSAGVTFVKSVVDAVVGSRCDDHTLILFTYDESGVFFDHVAPRPTNTADNKPYGPRVPFLAIGKSAKNNYVSHVTMEHSSIVKFIEWNSLNRETGQLGGRYATIANIGSMLGTTATGTEVPQ
jgi:phospholipase C